MQAQDNRAENRGNRVPQGGQNARAQQPWILETQRGSAQANDEEVGTEGPMRAVNGDEQGHMGEVERQLRGAPNERTKKRNCSRTAYRRRAPLAAEGRPGLPSGRSRRRLRAPALLVRGVQSCARWERAVPCACSLSQISVAGPLFSPALHSSSTKPSLLLSRTPTFQSSAASFCAAALLIPCA